MHNLSGQNVDTDKEPVNGVDAGRRSSFKLPSPLNTNDDLLDRNVWSPNRRLSSLAANGELWSSNSPRTTQPLLGSQPSGGSSLGSPKPTTPTRFEDPLLAMPSFRRSGGSPTPDFVGGSYVAAGTTSPLVLSPALRAGGGGGLSSTNSFSARCNHFLDFRRSFTGGGSPGVAGLGEGAGAPARARPTSARQPTLSAGNSYFGNLDFNMGYASSITGSESGGPGLDDDEVICPPEGTAIAAGAATAAAAGFQTDGGQTDSPVSSLLQAGSVPSRRHSTFAMRSPPGGSSPSSLTPTSSTVLAPSRVGGVSPPGRLASRSSEGEEPTSFGFLHHQQQHHYGVGSGSFRDRQRGGNCGYVGHCSATGGSLAPCEGGLQNQTHAVLEQLRGELKSLSMRSLPVGGGAAAAAAAAAGTAASSSSGGSTANNGGHVLTLTSHGSGGGGFSGPGSGRVSDGQQPQLSPPRLFVSRTNYSSGSGVTGSGVGGSDAGVAGCACSGGGDHGGGGAAREALPELFPPRQISSYNCTEVRTHAAAVQRNARGDEDAEQEAF